MKNNKLRAGFTLLTLLMILAVPLISARLDIGIDNPNMPRIIISISEVPPTINVNNSQYLQGYTPSTLKDWIQNAFDSVYAVLGYGDDWNKSYADNLYLSLTGGTITGEVSYVGADTTYRDNYGVVFGTGYDAEIYYNNANLVINPDAEGSGKVLIGVTGDDDLVARNITAVNYFSGVNQGLTANYSVGSCWMAYSGGIMYSTNCTAL